MTNAPKLRLCEMNNVRFTWLIIPDRPSFPAVHRSVLTGISISVNK